MLTDWSWTSDLSEKILTPGKHKATKCLHAKSIKIAKLNIK